MGTNAKIYDGKNAITGFLSVFTYFVVTYVQPSPHGFRVCVSAFSFAVCAAHVLVTNFVRLSIIRVEATAADYMNASRGSKFYRNYVLVMRFF